MLNGVFPFEYGGGILIITPLYVKKSSHILQNYALFFGGNITSVALPASDFSKFIVVASIAINMPKVRSFTPMPWGGSRLVAAI
jgi:hypothetical protein